jgi:hypothetical protein
VTIGNNEAWFNYTPNGGGIVSIEIHSTDPQGSGNHLRNISVVKQEHIAAYEAGEIFNPEWLDAIDTAHSLRFMDWMQTNDSWLTTSSDTPQVDDASWAIKGVPLAIMVQLANETGTDPWFNIPHLADDGYIRDFVTQVRDTLDPSLKAYFEFSNEVWNWQFGQAQHSHAEEQVRFPGEGTAWVQNYAADAVNMARIIDQVYGADNANAIKVIATQTGWLGLESAILDAPSWVAENPSQNAAPATYFDAYAITGYFDGGLGRGDKPLTVKSWLAESLNRASSTADNMGLSGAARTNYIEEHRFDHATRLAAQELRDGSVTGDTGGSLTDMRGQFAYHKSIADARGLDLVMYEGGTLFNAFTAVAAPSKFGSWGHLRYLGDENARMDAINAFLAANPKTAQSVSPVDDPSDVNTSDGQTDNGTGISVPVTSVDQTDPAQDVVDDATGGGPVSHRLNGTEFSDQLIGGAGNDILFGRGGNDLLLPDDGNDCLNGGLGFDTAALLGNQASYTLQLSQNGTYLIDRASQSNGNSARDMLVSIERLDFAEEIEVFQNAPLRLDAFERAATLSDADLEMITELYVAYFNRAPDAIGLTYWAAQYADGFDLPRMASSFFMQPETLATYADMLSADGERLENAAGFVTAVYANVLGRASDSDGFAYWINQLETQPEITPSIFILALLGGAKFPSAPTAQTALDQAYVAAKTDIGTYFAAIKGLSDVDDAIAVMSLFDGTTGGMRDAAEHVDALYFDALDGLNGEFLLQLVGVADDPFVGMF